MKNSVTGFLVYLCVVIATTYPMQKYTDPSIRSLAKKIEKIALNTKYRKPSRTTRKNRSSKKIYFAKTTFYIFLPRAFNIK